MYARQFICILLLWGCLLAGAQTRRLTGKIFDKDHQPLPGATVQAGNTSYGAIADAEGRYELIGKWNKGTILKFSFIGMKPKLVTYNGERQLDVQLTEDMNQMEEVVVTAKTNINEIDLRAKAGVVQTVDLKRIESKPMIDLGLALQGSVPGLMITNTGDLGSDPRIRIRGNTSLRKGNTTNEPLYVMDGQVISPETFYNLNPADIKDIKVLKDAASCALYGIKAANGVLEISTHRGSNGHTTVTYSMDMGVTTRGRRGVKMMDSAEKLELERLLQNPATPGYRYSADYYQKYYPDAPDLQEMIRYGEARLDSLRGIQTDWFKELLRINLYQKHNVSLRGGSEQTSYYLSANYTRQGGRLPGNDKQRMSMRLNLDQRLGKIGYLMMGVTGGYARTDTPNGTSSDPSALIYNLNPYEQPNGAELVSYPGRSYFDLMNQYSEQSTAKDAGASATLTLNPLAGLDVAAVAGLDFLLGEVQQFTPSTSYSETTIGVPEIERGIYKKSKNVTTNLSANVRVNYNRVFAGKHDLTVGANMDYYLTLLDNVGITGYGVGTINSSSAINQSLSGNRKPAVSGLKDKSAQLGFGGVFGYTFDGTYDLYATYKADASSILPADKRWNSAWAVSAGWTPTRYAFLEDQKVLTHLNLKASYGYTANLSGVSVSSTVATFAFSNGSYENQRPLDFITLYNKDLKPEQTKSVDVGLHIGLFDRVDISLNWYNRRTEQALLDVPIPSSTGYTSLQRNIGVLQNKGYEIAVNGRILDKGDWLLSLGVNFSYNSNKVLDLYYADKIYISEQSLLPDYEVGKAFDMLYGPHSLGINPLTGYPVFRTADGGEKQASEVLEAEDIVALGHLTPPCTGGINFSLSYKSFDLNADMYYVKGGIQPFNYSYVRNQDNAHRNAVSGQTEKMWFKPGDEEKAYSNPFYTNATAEDNLSLYSNSLTVGKSDYLKLSMVSLRYRLPSRFLRRNLPFVKYASLALQGSNLFTWTAYSESDPESGTLAGSQQPIYTVNVNLTF